MLVQLAQATGSIRLAGSSNSSTGRLEIYYNSQWGTVCQNNFGFPEANVACRELGYSGANGYGSGINSKYVCVS